MSRAPLRALLAAGLAFAVWGSAAADPAETAPAEPPGSIEFVGRNLFGKANGTFHAWRVVEREIDLDAIERSFASVEIDLASVDTGIERRDEHLRTDDFFDVAEHPSARVRVHSARRAGTTPEGLPLFSARFDVDLHGIQESLDGEVTLVSEKPLVFEGSLVLDRTRFGVGDPPSRWNPMSISADVPVRFRYEP